MHLPPIYPITDAQLATPLSDQIRVLGEAGYPLVQFRGKPLDASSQWRELRKALTGAAEAGGWPAICVNDRADLGVLAAAEGLPLWGLHLGQSDLPAGEARKLPGLASVHLGASTCRPEQWDAVDPACDHAGVGPIRATATKPDHDRPVGLDGLRTGAAALGRQGLAAVAIGGLTLEDADPCFRAGAESLSMVGEVARCADPGELLWQAQVRRWRARPPIRAGQGVVLIGGSGAGKSTLAGALGRALGLPARDSDLEVGGSFATIFQEQGEAAFRALEAAAVVRCLQAPCVAALGAGAWEDPATRARVRAAGFAPLWLAEEPARAWARVGGDPDRPLARERSGFMGRYARRSAAWWEAPMILPLGRSPEQLAQALVEKSC